MYSKIAEKEDNKMIEFCQRDTDGTLIFVSFRVSPQMTLHINWGTQTGLFAATVGALLTVSIPDLKPNSQDTSAFYLENIYNLFGTPNVSHPSIPSGFSVIKPPAFSPPRYTIWVNSLWFLSLAVSLSSATSALILRNWAVHYAEFIHWPSDTPVERARVRAFFSKGNPGPDSFFGSSPDHSFLHLSLLLFIVGGLIYLFNINRAVFYALVWWVGCMAIQYAYRTMGGAFGPTANLYHTPLSLPALRIYLGIFYLMVQFFSLIPSLHNLRNNTERRYRDLSERFKEGFLMGKRWGAEEIALKPSSEIDAQILERILLTLDEDQALETFFDTIPGFCASKLTVLPLSFSVQGELRKRLDGFLGRTFSSNSVSESVRASRLITCLDAAHAALGPYHFLEILDNTFNGHWDEALQSVEIRHALRLWGHGHGHDLKARRVVAHIITRVRERDDGWTLLVKETFGVPDRVFRDYLAHGDSVLLSILIHVSREASRAGSFTRGILSSLSKFDIHNTLPGLRHEFCTLWNEIAQEARNRGRFITLVEILDEIHPVYFALHQNAHVTPTPSSTSTDSLNQGTNASLAPFSAYTDSSDFIPDHLWSYPSCNIASHRPDSTTHDPFAISETVPLPTQPGDASPRRSTLKYSTALRRPEEANIITGFPSPPDPSTTSEIGETSHVFTATFPNHSF